ncbi:MAG TPA: LuxR C-terminal-related transcriptional regulator, partial [Candidatus Alistipes intestinipullorum]|nr:LuxR C-terminal-related transcriptional regulator [Candidatus Alistipes intestinipullorum]
EIAQQLGISENTVESHLKLSMKFLRDKLKDDHNDMLVNCIAIALIYYLP